MTKRNPKLINIKPISIRIGDEVSVTGYYYDAKITRTGTVVKRDVNAYSGTTDYSTAQGVTLLSVYKDGTADLRDPKVLLRNRNPDPTLFDWS
jgi:hypothetical protein